jgi:CysZ protein
MALLSDTMAALEEIFTPPFRTVLWSILGITLALLVVLVVAIHQLLTGLASPPYPWLAALLSIVEGLGLVLASIFLVAPVSALVAGFYVDDLAARVEADISPRGPVGRALPIGQAMVLAVRFALLSLAVMLVAVALLFVPGVNAIAFLGANAYLSGRQYFEFAALRHRSVGEATRLRQANPASVYGAGLVIAALLSVPLLNLLTPLFATALMVRVHARLARRHALLSRA